MKPAKKRVKTSSILFDKEADASACAMAEAGMSLRRVKASCKELTECQITYRHHKLAKEVYHYPKGIGLSTAWREGHSRLWKEFGPDLVAVAKQRILEEIPPLLEHPTPKTVEK